MRPTDVTLTLGQPRYDHEPVTLPLAKAPHILVAGMTGGGKSVVIHHILSQLIAHDPRWVNIVLIDPKHVEFRRYIGLRHMGWPFVAHTVEEAEQALGHYAIAEMQMRFHKMTKVSARTFDQMDPPYARTVIVIDELANIILRSKKLERYIVDLASMGRAAGLHLLMATQSPRADVITGLIKANTPTRIALPTITASESRIILDSNGAEKLEQPGDMLIRLPGRRELVEARGMYVSDEQIDEGIRRAMLL